MSDQDTDITATQSPSPFRNLVENRLAAVSLPLIPVFLGILLKIALVDKVNLPPLEHVVENHVRGIWLEFVSISYIGALAWGFGRSGTNDPALGQKLVVLSVIPAIIFILCLCFYLGLPKLGLSAPIYTVVVPAILGLASLVSTSLAIREFSRD